MPDNNLKPIPRNPFLDRMQLGDSHLQASLRCAQCNQPVQTGVQHVCPLNSPSTLTGVKENDNVSNS